MNTGSKFWKKFNIKVKFVPNGTEDEEGVPRMAHFVVEFNCNGQKQKIELWDIDDQSSVYFYYFFECDNENTRISFEFKYD